MNDTTSATMRGLRRRRTARRWLVALAAAAAWRPAPSAAAERPNIVVVVADDLGWGDLHCYGHPVLRTPRLDRLAASGTRFTQFYVASAVCSPSRAALLSGQFPARLRIHGHLDSPAANARRGMPDWLDPSVPLVTRALRQAGYATGHFGKWHLGASDQAPPPAAYGIDVSRTTQSTGPTFSGAADPQWHPASTAALVDEAVRFIDANRDRPFYVNLWTLLPHATLRPTPGQRAPYAQFDPVAVAHPGAMSVYYASVTQLDRDLGRLFDALDARGLAENTVVVFTSDNGPEDIHVRNASHSGVGSAGPFRGRKRSLYEGGVRVPLVVRWPGRVPAGAVDQESVLAAVDLFPTLCSLAGVDAAAAATSDGEDVSDVWRGNSRPRRRPLFWEWRDRIFGDAIHQSPRLAIRRGPWKLLMNPDRSRLELYDVVHDRLEVDNLAAAQPAVAESLAEELLAWHAELPAGPVSPRAGQLDYGWPASSTEPARPTSRLTPGARTEP